MSREFKKKTDLLTQQILNLEEENGGISNKNNELSRANQEYKQKLSSLESEYSILEEKVDQLTNENTSYKKHLSQCNIIIEDYKW